MGAHAFDLPAGPFKNKTKRIELSRDLGTVMTMVCRGGGAVIGLPPRGSGTNDLIHKS